MSFYSKQGQRNARLQDIDEQDRRSEREAFAALRAKCQKYEDALQLIRDVCIDAEQHGGPDKERLLRICNDTLPMQALATRQNCAVNY